jgi:hypothetical protein
MRKLVIAGGLMVAAQVLGGMGALAGPDYRNCEY